MLGNSNASSMCSNCPKCGLPQYASSGGTASTCLCSTVATCTVRRQSDNDAFSAAVCATVLAEADARLSLALRTPQQLKNMNRHHRRAAASRAKKWPYTSKPYSTEKYL